MKLARSHGANAPEPFDGERVEERQFAVRRDDEQPVGLCHAARHLGEKLRARDTDRDRKSDAGKDVAPQPHGDLDGRAGDPLHPTHVEKRFVDRDPLDERRRVVKHLEHRLARFAVRGHPRRNDDDSRAQPTSLPAAHRGTDPERLGLVARSEHDATADDHRPAAQARIVALLDRGVERVQVGMKDRRFAGHERMFAPCPASVQGFPSLSSTRAHAPERAMQSPPRLRVRAPSRSSFRARRVAGRAQ